MKRTVPLLDLKAQYGAIRDEIMPALEEVLESQHFILGPKVSRLEKEVAAYCKCQHAVGVSSGSDALLICLMAEEIGPGDEVITTPYTFFATAGVISRAGATPVFVDIEADTYNMAPNLIERSITPRTRAIIPVHLYGQCANMDPILEIANRYGLVVIEDAAQAIGAEYVSSAKDSGFKVCRAGSMGHYGCFSFFPSKNLGGFGDGGMVVTSDLDRAQRLRILRVHGSQPKYYHELVGGNFRLDAIQAAVLSVKLRHLDGWTAKRQENAAWYGRALKSSGLVEKGLVGLPKAVWKEAVEKDRLPDTESKALACHYHIYNQFVISTSSRDDLRAHLTARGIGTEIYYPVPLHLQRCFASLGYCAGAFPVSEEAAKKTLALPIYPELTSEQKESVVAAISGFWA
jgi:dTDP-4-amino-4,6-dideoxygalactose transaminase